MERYLRSKYQHKTLIDGKPQLPRKDSFDEAPPALPPKHGPKLGGTLRSTSSTYPARSGEYPQALTPASSASSSGRQSNDWKLTTLKEMGFTDESKNSAILKGVNGDFEKAVGSLIRLGEGGADAQIRAAAGAKPPQRPKSPPRPPRFPSPPARTSSAARIANDAAVHSAAAATTPAATSAQPPSSNPYNPFQQHSQPPPPPNVQSLENAFVGMSMGTPAAMVPSYTGNFSASSSQGPSSQTNPFFKTFTPPMSPNPYQSFQQSQQSLYQPATPYDPGYTHGQQSNPFLRTSRSQNFAISSTSYSPTTNTQPQQSAASYSSVQHGYAQPAQQFVPSSGMPSWLQSTDQVFGPQNTLYQEPQSTISSGAHLHGQPQYVSSPTHSPMPQPPTSAPPFEHSFSQTVHSQPAQQQMQPYGQQPHGLPQDPYQGYQQQTQHPPLHQPQQFAPPATQPLYTQPTGRMDKMSILSLYNAPHLAPPRLHTVQENDVATQPPEPQSKGSQATRSVTMPVPGTQNPFASLLPNGTRGIGGPSRESVDFVALQGGRQSPDAFGGLSARFT